MQRLVNKLGLLHCKHKLQFIDTASVPVIKLEIDLQKIRDAKQRSRRETVPEKMKVLGIDITFEDMMLQASPFMDDSHAQQVNLGIKCINYVKNLQQQLPDLKPMVLVLKKLFESKGLNSVYHGGISSYSIVLMVAAFLKNHRATGLNSSSKNFFEFLYFYGIYFNPLYYYIHGE